LSVGACGDSGNDSEVVRQCVEDGGARASCRCVHKVLRVEFSAEEYFG
jgi:hypothetical protein